MMLRQHCEFVNTWSSVYSFSFCVAGSSESHMMVKVTLTDSFPMNDCSHRVGRPAEFPEFPDQEAEGGVLQTGCQTGRTDRKQ